MRGFLSGISVLAVVFFCCAVSVSAQDIRRQEEAKARLEKEIAILDQQLAANADRSKDALTQLSLIQKKISNRKALIRQSDRQIRIYSDEIYSAQRQINRLFEHSDYVEDYGRNDEEYPCQSDLCGKSHSHCSVLPVRSMPSRPSTRTR